MRDIQYHELCQWVNGEIALNIYNSTETMYAPEHTHVIIGIDANSSTESDKENLLARLSAANLIPANGGRFGWVSTVNTSTATPNQIDNIIVSNNIIINNFEALSSLQNTLWSDHVPVFADLTLL
jgi:endonuclease/exonuclease/phosphatase family metal-dependent hydrolase